ncbi:hypothetical protein CB0940_06524 [Cercospora beticola]|uniref:Uncharacterized protein n=1 Tax=Cercospora beticola TaxID=122368 RepID=A0A2G5HZ27_CERBT|nr:hypothetical protein CB0940_06524 [Cercospora beticola]PIA97751.1 hypothetical protein CB0940_06524 [Cercospora beticola]WPA99162.1 hypothetical protein RHO25_003778 [Cercospora beticola]CAK1360476.1 unnamed protein product [Cercospora beticola]
MFFTRHSAAVVALAFQVSANPIPEASNNITSRQNPIWRVDFWTGDACSGANTGSYSGPSSEPPIDFQNCEPIPDIGVSQAVTYYGDLDYEFRIHAEDTCGDITEFYIGNQDSPLCIPLTEVPGAIAWSVQVEA